MSARPAIDRPTARAHVRDRLRRQGTYQHWMMTKETAMFFELGTVSSATKGFQPGLQTDPPIAGKTLQNVKRVAT
jgi:hypothetical protein